MESREGRIGAGGVGTGGFFLANQSSWFMLFDELMYPYQTVPPATFKNVVAPPTGDGMG